MHWHQRTSIRAALAGFLATGLALSTTPAAQARSGEHTSSAEARRVDRVKPSASFFDCTALTPNGEAAECATISLPLDYDQPKGPTTEVAVLRVKATNPEHKLGTLFLNPGGPGGSGVSIAAVAPMFLDPALLARFDIVGFDPRGVNFSSQVRCWPNFSAQATALKPISSMSFPWTDAEKASYVAASEEFGKACSRNGQPLASAMSTAEVARDMDVLRRLFGDKKLNYLGFSYGTELGQVYANMFPDRVRSMVIDGVLDPIAWTTGGKAGTTVPSTTRLASGEGADKAVHAALRLCNEVGPQTCPLAAQGDPEVLYDKVMGKLRQEPIVVTDPTDPSVSLTLTYADVVGTFLGVLYGPDAPGWVALILQQLLDMQSGATPAEQDAVLSWKKLQTKTHTAATAASRTTTALRSAWPAGAKRPGFDFPYDNSPEAFETVLCTDGINPARAKDWIGYAAAADERAPGFGPAWTWPSAPCASRTWTVRDEDAYLGPFTRRTASPVLVIGSFHDPATNYDGAVTVSKLLPNSRLLSSDNWGHTAYGTSTCLTKAVTGYLTALRLPAKGTVCVSEVPAFNTSPVAVRAVPDSGAKPLPDAVKIWPTTMRRN